MDLEPLDWKPERDLLVNLLEKVGLPISPFTKYLDAVRERRLRRVAHLVQLTADNSDSDPQSVLESFSDDRLAELLASALEAAAVTRGEQNVVALARVLAKAMQQPDDATIDHSRAVVRVLAELEPIDVIALRALEDVGPLPYGADLPRPFDILRNRLASDVLVSPVESKLERLALLNPGTKYDGDDQWHLVTPFGRALLAYLESAPTGGAG